ncbi:MAG: xanthine permease [Firmicutes bacterium]|nr:xanthine permease [Bacillota bacterium]
MAKMKLKYNLNDTPPFLELLLLGLQWLAIAIPTIIILGKVVAGLHFDNPIDQINYLQKLFFVAAISIFIQVIWGHQLPLIMGPAAVLLVGIVSSQSSNVNSVYSSIIIGGIILTVLSITGLFGYLKRLFTPRVVATILIMIAFTLTPMIMNLIINSAVQGTSFINLCFALILVIGMFVANKFLIGIWKSTLIIWSIIVGSLLYVFIVPQYQLLEFNTNVGIISPLFESINFDFNFEPGVLISFLVCFLALAINDLGSIQSVGELIKPGSIPKRITRGIAFTGLSNVLSGFLGVIGPVNFSLSTGVIASTGIASRFTLIPTCFGLLIISFLPGVIALIGNIPSVVVGTILIYILCSQISAGLLVAFNSINKFYFEYGLIIGLPLMLSTIISFLPVETLTTFPPLVRPIIGNGFVVGILTVLIMEHIIFKEKKANQNS